VAIKIALPKGRLLRETARLLDAADWGLSGYHESVRLYRLEARRFPDLTARVFHERDIPIQIAVGNYDLGICGLDWIEELLVKYPSSDLVKIKDLGYGDGALYAAVSGSLGVTLAEELPTRLPVIRIASEYPNLAESYALSLRLPRFRVFPLWGAAEVYPPESADLVVAAARAGEPDNHGLVPIDSILSLGACLIANRQSWETKDLSGVVSSICDEVSAGPRPPSPPVFSVPEVAGEYSPPAAGDGIVRLALPDGHQQQPAVSLLNKAGIRVDDYPSPTGNRRPATSLSGVTIKVIRPQDMPLQVANGNFDLAITGRDWLGEHRYQFPSSPVAELLDLKFGWVRVVAVVSKELSVDGVDSLREFSAERSVPLRVASEYINIADKYARDNHLGRYRVIPTWGASEAFLPGDADLLIENTETGRTIARHNLKIIDTLFESTACLVGNTGSVASAGTGTRISSMVEALRRALEAV